jgi:hypothetical protein
VSLRLTALDRVMIRSFVLTAMAALLAWSAADAQTPAPSGQTPPIIIATGGTTGAYFVAGQRLCQLINAYRSRHGLRCTVITSAGSVANLTALAERKSDLAIVQADAVTEAHRGQFGFVLGLHTEHLAVLVRQEDAMQTLTHLAGRRVDLGAEGSGTRLTADRILRAIDARPAIMVALPADQRNRALCVGDIDAVATLQGNPSVALIDATNRCSLRFLPATPAMLARVHATTMEIGLDAIPGGIYRNAEEEVPAFAVQAALIARHDLAPAIVQAIRATALRDVEQLRSAHPALRSLNRAELQLNTTVLPDHAGAK